VLTSDDYFHHLLAINCLDPFRHHFQTAFYGFFDIVKSFFSDFFPERYSREWTDIPQQAIHLLLR